jgi:hypothetical protein
MRAVPLIPSGSQWLRRKTARVLPDGSVSVRIATSRVPLEVHDLSVCGFAVSTAAPFTIGHTHRFVFTTSDGVEVSLVAKAVHCYARLLDGARTYVTGWEFMAGSAPLTEAAFERLTKSSGLQVQSSGF